MRGLLSFSLGLLGSLALSVGAHAAIERKTFEIRCQEFFAKVSEVEGRRTKTDAFSSSKVAIRQLQLASEYPEFPEEQTAVLKKVLAAKGAEVSLGELRKVSSGCEPVRYFGWASRLLQSADEYNFNTAQKNQLASALMSHFRTSALEPRPVLQQLLDLKLLKLAHERGVFKLSKEQSRKLTEKATQIQKLSAAALERDARIEALKAQVGEPATSPVELNRRRQLAMFDWEQLLNSEELREVLREILDLIDEE